MAPTAGVGVNARSNSPSLLERYTFLPKEQLSPLANGDSPLSTRKKKYNLKDENYILWIRFTEDDSPGQPLR